jgi:hypothetical protein
MADRKRRGMDLGQVLLWSAVLVEAPRWAGAMLAADLKDVNGVLSSALNTGNTISGVAMGLVNVVATAYMLDALRRERPVITVHRKAGNFDKANWRFYGMLIFVIGLLVLTPFVLAPFMVSRMTGLALETVLGTAMWQFIWSTTVVLAPIFVIGGVSFAQPGLVRISDQSPVVGNQSEEPKVSEKVTEKKSDKPVTYGRWKTWRKLPDAERQKIAGMVADDVIATYGVEERTAYNWIKDAKQLSMASVGEAGKKPARRKGVRK